MLCKSCNNFDIFEGSIAWSFVLLWHFLIGFFGSWLSAIMFIIMFKFHILSISEAITLYFIDIILLNSKTFNAKYLYKY